MHVIPHRDLALVCLALMAQQRLCQQVGLLVDVVQRRVDEQVVAGLVEGRVVEGRPGAVLLRVSGSSLPLEVGLEQD